MKKVWDKWNSISLVLRIVVGLVIGVVLGLALPQAQGIGILGTMFVSALKAIAPLLVLFLVMNALAQAKKGAGTMKSIVVLYIISTLVASLVAVVAGLVAPISLTLPEAIADAAAAPQSVTTVLTNLLTNAVANPIKALVEANYIGILVWSVALGVAFRAAGEETKKVLNDCSGAVSQAVRWVISCAPFGILGLVYSTVSTSGLAIFTEYGRLLLVLVGCMLFIALITNPILVAVCTHKNPYPLVLKCLKESGLTAFFTRSSAANIPVNMELCEELGLDEEAYSVSIPLGATINMAGAAVTITIMTMATIHTLGMNVSFGSALILSVLAAVSACGTSGVAGGSLLLIPLACALFGIPNDIAMQVVGVGFIIGVVQDSCETALNSSSDVLFTAAAEFRKKRIAK